MYSREPFTKWASTGKWVGDGRRELLLCKHVITHTEYWIWLLAEGCVGDKSGKPQSYSCGRLLHRGYRTTTKKARIRKSQTVEFFWVSVWGKWKLILCRYVCVYNEAVLPPFLERKKTTKNERRVWRKIGNYTPRASLVQPYCHPFHQKEVGPGNIFWVCLRMQRIWPVKLWLLIQICLCVLGYYNISKRATVVLACYAMIVNTN